MKHKKVTIHAIQTLPFHNLNAGEDGMPKVGFYGGYTRSRISSQSWKRAMREYFRESEDTLATRTRELGLLVTSLEGKGHSNDDATDVLGLLHSQIWGKVVVDKETKSMRSAVVQLMSQRDIDRLVDMAHENFSFLLSATSEKKQKSATKRKLKALTAAYEKEAAGTDALDLALFGRMVASNDNLGVMGAASIAHIMATSNSRVEPDFFTAVDDLVEGPGTAGMLETNHFSAGTYYRMGAVDFTLLTDNLFGSLESAKDALAAFIKAFVLSAPSGKRSGFFAHTVPDLILLEIAGQSYSLANAFVNPVRQAPITSSVKLLSDTWNSNHAFVGKPAFACFLTSAIAATVVADTPLYDVPQAGTLDELIASVMENL